MLRHPDIRVRPPDPTSNVRSDGANPDIDETVFLNMHPRPNRHALHRAEIAQQSSML